MIKVSSKMVNGILHTLYITSDKRKGWIMTDNVTINHGAYAYIMTKWCKLN